jgi:hypothetical protein
MFSVRFTRLCLGIFLPALLVLTPSMRGQTQTASPQLLPYFMTLVAGGGASATFTVGTACPSGNMPTDKFGDGCLATEVQLNVPRNVTEDTQGNIFVSDTENALIRRIDGTTGIITAIAGSTVTANPASGASCGGSDTNTSTDYIGDGCLSTSVKLSKPYGLAISPVNGNLYFGDIGNSTVRMIAAGSNGLTGPGIITNVVGAVAGTGGFGYAANTATTTAAIATGSALDDPYGVAFDKQGVLYIADGGKNALLAANLTANMVTVGNIAIPPGTIAKLAGATATPATSAFCPNSAISAAGVVSGTSGCKFGSWTNGASASTSQMDSPIDITVDPTGNVFFANAFDSSVAVGQVTPAGALNTYAGLQAAGTVTNTRGPADTVYLGDPFSVTADANGNVYASDALEGWVWRVDAANKGIYVVAGGGTSCNSTASGDGCPASQTKFSTGVAITGSISSGLPTGSATATPPTHTGVGGIFTDNTGALVVTDTYLGLIHKIVTNTNFGTILPTMPTQTIDIHFGVGDTPNSNMPYVLTTNPTNFSIGAAICTPNSDDTQDCLLPITATPQQLTSGPFSSTLVITSSMGLTSTVTLSGNLNLVQAASSTSLAFSTTTANPATPVTITANISSPTASASSITGTVIFYNNGVQIGTTQTVSNGTAAIMYTFPAGMASITATYSGSQAVTGSSSTATTITSAIPTFTIAPMQQTLTVVQGNLVTTSFTLATAGGYAGTVTFACSGLPANTSCIFNPASVTLGASASVESLSILTTGTNSAAVRPLAVPGSHRGGQVLFAFIPGAALLLLSVRRRFKGMLPVSLLLLTVLMGSTAFLSGCNNNSMAAATPVTPAGTSTVTITATGTPNVITAGANIVQTVSVMLSVTAPQ